MKTGLVPHALLVSFAMLSCGPKVEPTEPEPAPAEPESAPEPAPTSEESVPPAPSAEEIARADAAKKLEADRVRLKENHATEVARWTPALRAEANALASKTFATGRTAIQAALRASYRKSGNVQRDGQRHPLETLEFFGLQPTMTVLEYGPGEGWYTELLAPILAKKGKLLVTNTDPKGPTEQRSTYYGERVQLLLESAPELYGKVETITFDPKAPKLGLEGKLDLALIIRGLHGMVNAGTLEAWLGEVHTALEPKGVLGIVQHRARPDATPEESSKQGYLPEAWVIEKCEAAGFSLSKKSEINANPRDTKDYAGGVWTLPPSLSLGDLDREKYVAIGESDRMTLKFVKK